MRNKYFVYDREECTFDTFETEEESEEVAKELMNHYKNIVEGVLVGKINKMRKFDDEGIVTACPKCGRPIKTNARQASS